MTPAGFWVRAGAFVIDGLVWVCLNSILSTVHVPWLLRMLLPIVYEAVMVAVKGQTLGKMLAGAKVVAALDGSPVSRGQAAGRAVIKIISMPLFLIAAFTDRKRALHDMAAGTAVIYPQQVSKLRRGALAAIGALLPCFLLAMALAAVLFVSSGRRAGIPQFTERAKEGGNKSGLNTLRGALALYYGAHQGAYPASLPDGVQTISELNLPAHGKSSSVTAYGDDACDARGGLNAIALHDTGTWGYVGDKTSKCWGMVFIDCSHSDSAGIPWHRH